MNEDDLTRKLREIMKSDPLDDIAAETRRAQYDLGQAEAMLSVLQAALFEGGKDSRGIDLIANDTVADVVEGVRRLVGNADAALLEHTIPFIERFEEA